MQLINKYVLTCKSDNNCFLTGEIEMSVSIQEFTSHMTCAVTVLFVLGTTTINLCTVGNRKIGNEIWSIYKYKYFEI